MSLSLSISLSTSLYPNLQHVSLEAHWVLVLVAPTGLFYLQAQALQFATSEGLSRSHRTPDGTSHT
jgi:hypothetical protein